MTAQGCEAIKGQWRYHQVFTGVGERKNEIERKAHGEFDDSDWELLQPETLGQGRGPGKYSWCWYRIEITIPAPFGKSPDNFIFFRAPTEIRFFKK
jgi:hypothetical protein